jgi:hypothetical protein
MKGKMKIYKCTFSVDKWGFYLTPLIGYSNMNGDKKFWIGIWRWLWEFQID